MIVKTMLCPKKIDSAGRIKIPSDLFQLAIPTAKSIAFCFKSEHVAILKDANNVSEKDIVLFVRTLDERNRVTVPKELRKVFKTFEVYVLNHEILLIGVD